VRVEEELKRKRVELLGEADQKESSSTREAAAWLGCDASAAGFP